MSDSKYRYIIYPDRIYILEGTDIEILGQDIVNLVPNMLLQKYLDATTEYETTKEFDITLESW